MRVLLMIAFIVILRQLMTEPGSLRRHAKAKHEGVKYDCNQCDFQSGYRADLTIHIKSKHEGLGVSHSSLCL